MSGRQRVNRGHRASRSARPSAARAGSEPLVLVGGMGCSPRLWSGVRGRLGSGAVLDGRLDRPSVDGCVDALLDTLPRRFALAGLSLGGIVAMALVRRAPQRVARLALLSTSARAPRPAQRIAWAEQRAALAAGRTARELQAALLPVLLHRSDSALADQALAMADDTGERALDHQLAAQTTRVDEWPALALVGVPTLVLAAREDRLCPVERHAEIADRVPGARLQVLEGVGHLFPLEAPEAVAAALREWRELRPAARRRSPSARG